MGRSGWIRYQQGWKVSAFWRDAETMSKRRQEVFLSMALDRVRWSWVHVISCFWSGIW